MICPQFYKHHILGIKSMIEPMQSDREKMIQMAAEMPAYFAAINACEKPQQDFVNRWQKEGSLFQGAVLRYLADNIEDVYYLLANVGALIVGQISGRAKVDGFDAVASERAASIGAAGFYLSLGLQNLRGENFVLLHDGLCESNPSELSLILTQLNTKATSREEVMDRLDAIRNSKSKRPALFERIQALKNQK
jgi:hypothetical protein